MPERKLNYHFHNPNTAAATADHLLKVFLDANRDKVEAALQAAAQTLAPDIPWAEDHSQSA